MTRLDPQVSHAVDRNIHLDKADTMDRSIMLFAWSNRNFTS